MNPLRGNETFEGKRLCVKSKPSARSSSLPSAPDAMLICTLQTDAAALLPRTLARCGVWAPTQKPGATRALMKGHSGAARQRAPPNRHLGVLMTCTLVRQVSEGRHSQPASHAGVAPSPSCRRTPASGPHSRQRRKHSE